MVALASADLSRDESAFLEVAVAAKMLQWLEWRRFLPSLDDISFIRRAFARTRQLQPDNRMELKRLYSVLAARLARAGRWRSGAALAPPEYAGVVLARAVLGRC